MKRIYHHYEKWEDWQNGMFENHDPLHQDKLIWDAKGLLINTTRLLSAMETVITHWTFSAEENMSHRGRNRQAWLGQSACCLVCGTPEHLTKIAWNMLDEFQKSEANKIADIVIKNWDEKHG